MNATKVYSSYLLVIFNEKIYKNYISKDHLTFVIGEKDGEILRQL